MEATHLRIGTVDVPARIERERYFGELSYLELSALFAGPQKPSTFAKWTEGAPAHSIGLVAPFVFTHRQPPAHAKLWDHDATTGDFRDSALARAALGPLREAVQLVGAPQVIFRSPDTFSASAANRELLRHFFSEVASPDALGAGRVWSPGGLWDVRTAAKLATELDVTLAFDPLVRDPSEPPEIYDELEVTSLYFRIESAGRSGTIRNERLEDLVVLLEHYEAIPITIAFASPERWQDARNFKKLLADG